MVITIELELWAMWLVTAGLPTKSEEVDKGPTILWGPKVQLYHVRVKMRPSQSLNNSFNLRFL